MRTAVTLLLAGCHVGPALVEGFEEDLLEKGGCADLYAFAVDEADTTLLEVRLSRPLEEADGAPLSRAISLPDALTEVNVQLGRSISDAACDDEIVNGGPKIRDSWEAVSGTVTVEVVPSEELDGEATANVTLEDIVLESPGGEKVELDVFSWSELSARRFAG